MEVILVHGFCGLPQDWNSVRTSLLEKKPNLRIHTPNLWVDVRPSQFSNLEVAAEKLASLYSEKDLIVVGYSLGGRIVSHWPQSEWPGLKKMILVSAHGGLSNREEKTARQEFDRNWSKRFLNEEWNKVVADWNEQPVFAEDTARPTRHEVDFNRQELAAALRNWSLSSQQHEAFEPLSKAQFPIEYVVGQKDTKYLSYAETLQSKQQSWNYYSLPAGHSPHFSHACELAEVILTSLC